MNNGKPLYLSIMGFIDIKLGHFFLLNLILSSNSNAEIE